MPTLAYTDPSSGQAKSFEFRETNATITLGRNQGNDIRIENSSISRQHARLEVVNGSVTFVDLGSSNGSFINGTKVMKSILSDGDVLKLGEVELVYRDLENEDDYPPTNHSIYPPERFSDDTVSPVYTPLSPSSAQFLGHTPSNVTFQSSIAAVHATSAASYASSEAAWAEENPNASFPDTPASNTPANFADIPRPKSPSSRLPLGPSGFAAQQAANKLPIPNQTRGDAYHDRPSDEQYQPLPSDAILSDSSAHGKLRGTDTSSPSGAPPIPPAALSHNLPIDSSEIDGIRQERDALLDIVEGKAEDINTALAAQIRRIRVERDKLIVERRKLNKQLSDLQEDLNSGAPSPDRVETLEKNVELLELEKSELTERNTLLDHELENVKKQIREIEAKCQELEEERDQLHARLEEGTTDAGTLEQLQQTLDAEREEFQLLLEKEKERSVKALDEEKERSKLAIDDLRQQTASHLEAKEEELSAAKQSLDELNTKYKDLVAEHESLKENNVQPSEVIEAELSAKHKQIDELLIRCAEQETLNQELKDTLEQAPKPQELQDLRDEVEALKKELSSETDQRTSETEQRQALETQRDELLAEVRELRESVENLERLQKESDDSVKLKEERDQLQDEILQLKDSLDKAHKDSLKKRKIFEELSGDLRSLVLENERLKNQLSGHAPPDAANPAEVAALKQQLQEMERKLFEVIVERDKLEDQLRRSS